MKRFSATSIAVLLGACLMIASGGAASARTAPGSGGGNPGGGGVPGMCSPQTGTCF